MSVLGLAMLNLNTARPASYAVTDLGPGVAWGINSAGKVAASIGGQAVLFDGKSTLVLPLFSPPAGPPFTPTDAVGINDADEVLANGSLMFVGPAVAVYRDGAWPFFQGSYGVSYVGTGINQGGTVCGYLDDAMTMRLTEGFISGQADAGPLSFWNAINSLGVVAGKVSTNYSAGLHPSYYQPRACIYTNNSVVFLDARTVPGLLGGAPDDDLSSANSINDNGWVVGFVRPTFPGARLAFLCRGAGLEQLGTLGGAESEARFVGNSGSVVGWANTAAGRQHAFLYEGGTMRDMNDRLPAGSGWELQQANGINMAGQVVGYGLYQGAQHAFVLSPTDLQPPPVITVQPVGGEVPIGGSLTLSVEATSGPLFYQWLKDRVNLSGATNQTLPLTHANAFIAGLYRVVVSNASGQQAVSLDAAVTVFDPKLLIATYAGITVQGEVGGKYRLDYAPQASSTTWTELTTLQLTNSTQVYIDFDSPMHPQRVYRAVRVSP